MAKESRAFGSQRARKAHLLRGTGGLSAEIADLRNDVEEGMQNLEAKSGYPMLDALDNALLAAGQASFALVGRELLQGQTFDALTLGLVNAAFTVTNLKPGKSNFRVVVTQGLAGLVVTFANGLLTVELAAANSTSTEVVAAINNVANPTYGIIHAVVGGTGADDVLVATETPMAGGDGLYAGNNVYINGQSCNPVQAADQWTDTSITVLVPALTGRAAADIAAVVVESDGVMTGQLGAVLT